MSKYREGFTNQGLSHTHLCTVQWRVCAVLATQTNVTKCDSVIVLTKIWTLRLQSAL